MDPKLDGRAAGQHLAPLRQRRFGLTGALEQMTQVEPGVRKVWLQLDRPAISRFGLCVAMRSPQQGAQVETGHMAQRGRAISDPALVLRHRSGVVAGLLQTLGPVHHIGQRELRPGLRSRGIRGIWTQGNRAGHGGPFQAGRRVPRC